jgi:ribosomal-protein-alanine N-acetyltransferase
MGIRPDPLVMNIRFEQMVASDLPEVMEIERLVFPSPWTPGLFLHELKLPFSRLTVARLDSGNRRVIGYVCWWVIGDEVHILNLAVHPEYQRAGIGRELVHLVLSNALSSGAASVTLEVRSENTAAKGLYESFGFAGVGRRRNYYGRGEDAIIMMRRLAPVEGERAAE